MGVPIWRRAHSQEQYLEEKPEPDENWRMYIDMCCVVRIPGTLSLVWNVLKAPPGGEGWPRNSKNENLSASQSANCNISHLVKAAAPLTCLGPSHSIFHSIGETLNIYWEKPKECTSGQVD